MDRELDILVWQIRARPSPVSRESFLPQAIQEFLFESKGGVIPRPLGRKEDVVYWGDG